MDLLLFCLEKVVLNDYIKNHELLSKYLNLNVPVIPEPTWSQQQDCYEF